MHCRAGAVILQMAAALLPFLRTWHDLLDIAVFCLACILNHHQHLELGERQFMQEITIYCSCGVCFETLIDVCDHYSGCAFSQGTRAGVAGLSMRSLLPHVGSTEAAKLHKCNAADRMQHLELQLFD